MHVCNGCFFIKELWHWYAIMTSNGFHVVSFYKNLISYFGVLIVVYNIYVPKDWIVGRFFVYVIRVYIFRNHSLSTCYWRKWCLFEVAFLIKVECYIEWEEGSNAKLVKIIIKKTGKCENWVMADECRLLSATVKLTPRTSPFVYSNNNHYINYLDHWDNTFLVAL